MEENSIEFWSSVFGREYKDVIAYEDRETDKRMRADYVQLCRDGHRTWAREFMSLEYRYSRKAEEVMELSLSNTADWILSEILYDALEEYVEARKYSEQVLHESVHMKVEEALSWTEIDIFEEFWTFYIPSMLNAMLEVPDFRKGMLEYAGMIKLSMKKQLNIDLRRKNDGKEWFDSMFKKAAQEEEAIRPLNPDKAVVRMQRIARGYLGRRKIRQRFLEVYSKRFDPSSRTCYYVNLLTGETSWDRPPITSRLFKNSTW